MSSGLTRTIGCSLCLLVGCGPPAPMDPSTAKDTGQAQSMPIAMIHSGLYPYEPLEPGGRLPIEFGQQGGFHVMLAAKVQGIDPGSPTLELALQHNDIPMITWEVVAPDGMLSDEPAKRTLADQEDSEGILLAPQLVVLRYYEFPPAAGVAEIAREQELETMPITVNVAVEDAAGSSATNTLQVHLDFPSRKGPLLR